MNHLIQLPHVQDLLASWWYDYDEGVTHRWPDYFAEDVSYSSRTDSPSSPQEKLVRSDLRGREQLLKFLAAHRRKAPLPIRHLCMNVHVVETNEETTFFRCYILVAQVSNSQATPIAVGRCTGTMRHDDDTLRIETMAIVFDVTDSAGAE